MKPILITLLAAATLAATPALADRGGHGHGRGASACAREHGGCRGFAPGHGRNDFRHGGRHWDGDDRRHDGRHGRRHDHGDTTVIIRIGGDARYDRRWDYHPGYRVRPAPWGQEYRIINNQLVLVDSQTLQIIAILGLLTALMN